VVAHGNEGVCAQPADRVFTSDNVHHRKRNQDNRARVRAVGTDSLDLVVSSGRRRHGTAIFSQTWTLFRS